MIDGGSLQDFCYGSVYFQYLRKKVNTRSCIFLADSSILNNHINVQLDWGILKVFSNVNDFM